MREGKRRNKLYIAVAAMAVVVAIGLIVKLNGGVVTDKERNAVENFDIGQSQETAEGETLSVPEMLIPVTTVPSPDVTPLDYPVSTEFPRSSPIPMPVATDSGPEGTSEPEYTTLPMQPGDRAPIATPAPTETPTSVVM